MEHYAIFASLEPIRQGYITIELILLVAVGGLCAAVLIPHLVPLLKPLVHRMTDVSVRTEKGKVDVEVKLVPAKAAHLSPNTMRPKDPLKARKKVSEATKRSRLAKRKDSPPEPPNDKAP